DSLLLAAGELGRPRAALVSEADTVEELVGPRQALSPGDAAQAERQRDELACGELGGERERVVLVGVAERARSVRGEPAGPDPCRRPGRGRRTGDRAPRECGAASSSRSRSDRGR